MQSMHARKPQCSHEKQQPAHDQLPSHSTDIRGCCCCCCCCCCCNNTRCWTSVMLCCATSWAA
jgi:hypothetical protein